MKYLVSQMAYFLKERESRKNLNALLQYLLFLLRLFHYQ